ncbi:serine hydrolase domain-containing protein [Hellea balneolensis]|uniref:serine hydrolase domain-containing protein n=1 Tax=Hellea balneolensis TaxID=287478 RepID=UPI00138B1AF1|nr:serine hydrolase domain-containing protein [Hellea balneolensis]
MRPTAQFTGQQDGASFTGVTMISRLIISFIISLSFVFTAAANVSSQVRTPGIDIQELDKRADQLMHQLEMVGLSVAVVEDGKMTWAKGYGETLRNSNSPVTADTVFRWASVSKGVAAATVLSLEEEGHFSLAEPAKFHASSLELPASDKPITIEDLLSHRVGIVRNAYDNRIEGGKGAKTVRRALKELKYLCEPGTCHTYQNAAYDASSEIIESVTGLPYKAVVQDRIFGPLGMDTASTTLEGLQRSKSWAKPHGRFGNRINRVKETYYRVPAAAGVNSSVKDLAKWMMAQMPAEQKLPETILVDMQTPRIITPREQRFMRRKYRALENAHYGLGWRVYDYTGHKVIGHRGGVQGYRALVLFDPEKRSGIAMMWNSPHSRPIGLQLEFMDQLYGLPKRDWLRLNK